MATGLAGVWKCTASRQAFPHSPVQAVCWVQFACWWLSSCVQFLWASCAVLGQEQASGQVNGFDGQAWRTRERAAVSIHIQPETDVYQAAKCTSNFTKVISGNCHRHSESSVRYSRRTQEVKRTFKQRKFLIFSSSFPFSHFNTLAYLRRVHFDLTIINY